MRFAHISVHTLTASPPSPRGLLRVGAGIDRRSNCIRPAAATEQLQPSRPGSLLLLLAQRQKVRHVLHHSWRPPAIPQHSVFDRECSEPAAAAHGATPLAGTPPAAAASPQQLRLLAYFHGDKSSGSARRFKHVCVHSVRPPRDPRAVWGGGGISDLNMSNPTIFTLHSPCCCDCHCTHWTPAATQQPEAQKQRKQPVGPHLRMRRSQSGSRYLAHPTEMASQAVAHCASASCCRPCGAAKNPRDAFYGSVNARVPLVPPCSSHLRPPRDFWGTRSWHGASFCERSSLMVPRPAAGLSKPK